MITIKEIARLAGVSIGTVDRVLHDRKGVAPGTRDRVLEIVKENNYEPNLLARNLVMAKSYQIAVMIPFPEQDNSYWELPLNGIKRAFRELNFYKFIPRYFFYDKYDISMFIDKWKDMVRKLDQFDGLILSPHFSRRMNSLIGELPADFPYLFIDSYLNESNSLSFVGQDAKGSGELAAFIFGLMLDAGSRVMVLRALPLDFHIEDRIKGFLNNIFSKIEVKIVNVGKNDPKLNEILISEFGKIDGFFVPYADCSSLNGLYDECLANGRKPKIIAYDLTESNLELLKKGFIEFLICQRSNQQGYESVKLLFDYLVFEKSIPKRKLMPIDIVTKYNYRDYLLY